jgi:hypothetical protein
METDMPRKVDIYTHGGICDFCSTRGGYTYRGKVVVLEKGLFKLYICEACIQYAQSLLARKAVPYAKHCEVDGDNPRA